jgi:hypothetical protein
VSSLFIKSTDQTRVVVGGVEYIGAPISTSFSTLGGELHIRSLDASNKYLCWTNSANNQRYAIKGILVDTTTETAGSVWANSNGLRFSHGGNRWRCDQTQITNSITGTTIRVYSSTTNRTNNTSILATITAGSTATLSYLQNFYLRVTGTGTNPVNSDRDILLTKAGFRYVVSGTYVQGDITRYSCACDFNTSFLSNSCSSVENSALCGNQGSDGFCTFDGFICRRVCNFSDTDGFTYLVMEYRCVSTVTQNAYNGQFTSGPTVTIQS